MRLEAQKETHSLTERKTPTAQLAVGAKVDSVGAPGFEPGTSCSQSRRDTGLRYAPKYAQVTIPCLERATHLTARERRDSGDCCAQCSQCSTPRTSHPDQAPRSMDRSRKRR